MLADPEMESVVLGTPAGTHYRPGALGICVATGIGAYLTSRWLSAARQAQPLVESAIGLAGAGLLLFLAGLLAALVVTQSDQVCEMARQTGDLRREQMENP